MITLSNLGEGQEIARLFKIVAILIFYLTLSWGVAVLPTVH